MDTRHYLVDKHHPLPEDYIPYDLDIAPIPFTCPTDSPKHLMCRVTFDSLKKMHNDSLKEGLTYMEYPVIAHTRDNVSCILPVLLKMVLLIH